MKKMDKQKNTRKKKKRQARTIIMSCLMLFLCICLGAGIHLGYTLSKLNDGVFDISESNGESYGESYGKSDGKLGKRNFVNILVMGVDIGIPGASKNTPKRTDTIILANYKFETKKLNLVSIPRDTYIEIDGSPQKINAAHAFGKVPLLIKSVQNLLDVNIDYYCKIDYSGFRAIIDSIGGIDMDITRRMDYDDPTQNLSIHFKKGTVVHLDGKKAEEFFRWRKNNDGTGFVDGDIGRIKNQQKFIEKVFDKFKSPAIIPKIPGILKIIPEYVETDMNVDEIIKYGLKFANIDFNNLQLMTLNGESNYLNRISYFFYDEKQNEEIQKIIHGENYTFVDRSGLKIKIANCTQKPGLAKNFSDYLNRKDYNNTLLFNGEYQEKSKVVFYGVKKDIIEIVKKDFKISNIEINSSKQAKFDIMVVLGNDHDYIKAHEKRRVR